MARLEAPRDRLEVSGASGGLSWSLSVEYPEGAEGWDQLRYRIAEIRENIGSLEPIPPEPKSNSLVEPCGSDAKT